MVILATDLKLYYSGGAAKSTPDGNQGGAISSVAITEQDLTTTTLIYDTEWKDVTRSEAINGVTKYHCYYLKNNNLSQTATGIKIWKSGHTPLGDKTTIGYAGTAANTLEQALGFGVTQTSIYNVVLNDSQQRLDNDRNRAGQMVTSSKSPLYNQPIVALDAYTVKNGNPPAGSLACKVRNWDSETIKVDFGSVNISTIGTSPALSHFENLSNTYKMKLNDIISFEYNGRKTNDFIAINRIGTDPVNYSMTVNYDGSQWRHVSDFDLCMKVYITNVFGGIDTQKPTGVTFLEPLTNDVAIALPDLAPSAFVGFWLALFVPARTGITSASKTEFSIAYDS